MKRLTDIVVAAMVLILSSPVLLAIAMGTRMSMGSPILFRQVRPGRGGVPFTIFKFRTMLPKADNECDDDAARLTRFGAGLRATSLDELPGLWNVLVGDMSLVGPRPLLMDYLPLYSAEQFRRHEVRPGVTGLAQVSGRNALSWEQKFALDVWYVDHRSTWLDIKILWRTIVKVLAREGISAEGEMTMPRFMGEAKK